MKKQLLIFACLGFITSALAQEKETNSKKITYGIKAGLNLSSQSGYFSNDTKSKLNYHVGFFAELRLSEKFAIQPELHYSVQGAEFDIESNLFGNFVISDTYRYINVPIMAKYFVTEKLSAEVGPQIGYLVSAERDFNLSSFSTDLTGGARVDFGVNFGLGYKLSKHLSVGARYNLGLTEVTGTPTVQQKGSGKLKNSVFQASIGYSF